MISGGWMSCWVESANLSCKTRNLNWMTSEIRSFHWVSTKKLSKKLKRCHEWSLVSLPPIDLDWLFIHRKTRESITWSPFQASLLRMHSWSPARSFTVRHSSVSSREKIETNSIYLRYTNGTRFTSPKTCCKRAQTYINQTHSISEKFRCLFM